MIEIEINIAPNANLADAERIIEKCRDSERLILVMKDALAKYPGSVHWHFKKNSQRGTLEITLWRKASRLWFSVQAGRTTAWLEKQIEQLKAAIEQRIDRKN